MGFQDFYVMNMNAWIDCLSDLYKDTGMTRFLLSEGEAVHIEVTDTESFKSRLPEILDALIECSAFVNQRYAEDSKLPPISLVFLSKSAKEYSIHSASLDVDEFRIAGVSLTINLCYSQHSSLKLKFAGSGRKSAG